MTELIQQFLTSEIPSWQQQQDIGSCSKVAGIPESAAESFVENFQDYIDKDSRLNPLDNGTFFVYMFLGSLLTLSHCGLMKSIGTEKMLVWKEQKDEEDIEVIHICFYQILNHQKKLVLRTIDLRKHSVEPNLDDDTLRDVINQLGLNANQFSECQIDWQMLTVSKEPSVKLNYKLNMNPINVSSEMYEKIKEIINVNSYQYYILYQPKLKAPSVHFLVIKENPVAHQQFSEFFNQYVENKFERLSITMSSMFTMLNDQFLSGIIDSPLIDYHAFVAGSIVMNMKSKYNLHCVIENFNDQVIFKFVPRPKLEKELNINIPIFIEPFKKPAAPSLQTDIQFKHKFDTTQYSNFLTDAKAALKAFPVNAGFVQTLISTLNEPVDINQGMMHKFCKYYKHFLFEMAEKDIKSIAFEEVKYILQMSYGKEKQFLSHYLFGELLSLQPKEFREQKILEKFRHIYKNNTINEKVTTFAMSNNHHLWLMVHIYNQDYEKEKVRNSSYFTIQNLFPQTMSPNSSCLHIDIQIKELGYDVTVRKERNAHGIATTTTFLQSVKTINVESTLNFDESLDLMQSLPNALMMHEDLITGSMELKAIMRGLFNKYSLFQAKLNAFESVFGIYQMADNTNSSKLFAHYLQSHVPNHEEIKRNARIILIKCKLAYQSDHPDYALKLMSEELLDEYIIAGNFEKGSNRTSLVSLLFHKSRMNSNKLQLSIYKQENVDISSLVPPEQPDLIELCFDEEHVKTNMDTECLITWEDIYKIGGTASTKDELSSMQINSTKYLNTKKGQSKEENKQMNKLLNSVNLTSKQIIGKDKEKAFKVIHSDRILNSLNQLGNMAHKFTQGIQISRQITNITQRNYRYSDIYGVLLATGVVSMNRAYLLKRIVGNLPFAQKFLSSVFQSSSAFAERYAPSYNLYDLVESLKRNVPDESTVEKVVESAATFTTVDATEAGLLLSGTGTIIKNAAALIIPGAAFLGAAVFITRDAYSTSQQLEKIKHYVHLSVAEEFYQGLRLFFGLSVSEYISKMVKEKDFNDQSMKFGVNYLQNLTNIQAIIFPMYDYLEHDDHKHKVTHDRILLVKVWKNQWRSPVPEAPNGFKLICFPESSYTNFSIENAIPHAYYMHIIFGKNLPKALIDNAHQFNEAEKSNGYICRNGIGIEKKETLNNSAYLIDLKSGNDFAIGIQNRSNIFLLGDGSKNITGGSDNDNFMLYGNEINGIINGGDGINIIDFTNFANSTDVLNITLNAGNPSVESSNNKTILLTNIQVFLGRKKSDAFICSCETMYIDGQNYDDSGIDFIYINDTRCHYNVQFKVSGMTEIMNNAEHGEFAYLIAESKVKSNIYLNPKVACGNVQHKFAFDYPFLKLTKIEIIDNDLENGTKSLRFFSKENKNNLTIQNFRLNNTYHFSDDTIIKIDDGGHLQAYVYTNESVNDVIKKYPSIATRLDTFIIVWSRMSNSSIMIGHENRYLTADKNDSIANGANLYSANIMYNNPQNETHFVNGLSENVYIIACTSDAPKTIEDCKFKDVTVHGFSSSASKNADGNPFINTLHLGKMSKSIEHHLNGSMEIKIKTYQPSGDLDVHLTISQKLQYNLEMKIELGKVVFKGILLTNAYKYLHIVNNGPFHIFYNSEINYALLAPMLIKFEKDVSQIVITIYDIEPDMVIKIPKNLGRYYFLKQNHSMILTNVFHEVFNEDESSKISILFQDYYFHQKAMNSLKLDFLDKKLYLLDYNEEINKAESVESKIKTFIE